MREIKNPFPSGTALMIAFVIIFLWGLTLWYNFQLAAAENLVFTVFMILVQTHLFTGLFITAHDAMHHLISPNRLINHGVGWICAAMFMFNHYGNLYPKHHDHHRYPATEKDPDYSTGGFFAWYLSFVKQYVTVWQILAVGILYNVLAIWISQWNLILFWVIPSVLSTLQLFYFGTFLPHRGSHELSNKHRARSWTGGPVSAFLTCYFFGYHYEHHDRPDVPWWRLATVRKI